MSNAKTQERLYTDVSVVQFDPTTLTPDTEPEVIAEAQRVAITEALAFLGTEGVSVEVLSYEVILPPDVVHRRLLELGVRVWQGFLRTKVGVLKSPRVPSAELPAT